METNVLPFAALIAPTVESNPEEVDLVPATPERAAAFRAAALKTYGDSERFSVYDGEDAVVREAADGSGAWVEGFVWIPAAKVAR